MEEGGSRDVREKYSDLDLLTVEELQEYRCLLEAEFERVRRLGEGRTELIEAAPELSNGSGNR